MDEDFRGYLTAIVLLLGMSLLACGVVALIASAAG